MAILEGEPFVRESQARYARHAAIAVERLRTDRRGRPCPEPTGAFYVFPRLDGLADSFDFCEWLVRERGVGLAPGSAFGLGRRGAHPPLLRRRRGDPDRGPRPVRSGLGGYRRMGGRPMDRRAHARRTPGDLPRAARSTWPCSRSGWPTARTADREVVVHRGAVALVPMVDRDHVCLLKNYRYTVGRTLWRSPPGRSTRASRPTRPPPASWPRRPATSPGRITRIADWLVSPGVMTERMYLYLCEDLPPGPTDHQPDERIEPVVVAWAEAIAMVDDGRIEDAKSMLGHPALGPARSAHPARTTKPRPRRGRVRREARLADARPYRGLIRGARPASGRRPRGRGRRRGGWRC